MSYFETPLPLNGILDQAAATISKASQAATAYANLSAAQRAQLEAQASASPPVAAPGGGMSTGVKLAIGGAAVVGLALLLRKR